MIITVRIWLSERTEHRVYKITKVEQLTETIYLMDVVAPRVANKCLPGQFVIVRGSEDGERIALTICDYSREDGTITIVFQVVGAATEMMKNKKAGDSFADFVGPLGCPSEFCKEDIEELKKKKILFVAGGVGTAPVYPQVKWLHEQGIEADVIVGGRNKSLIILEDKMKKVAGNLYITTDDGSYGSKGVVTNEIQKLVCKLTKELEIPTVVSLNPIMVDGTGMCGACRVTVGGEVKFACVDGPEFDGHKVNFEEAMQRQQLYKTAEGRAFLAAKEGDTHHGGCGNCGGDK